MGKITKFYLIYLCRNFAERKFCENLYAVELLGEMYLGVYQVCSAEFSFVWKILTKLELFLLIFLDVQLLGDTDEVGISLG